MCHEYTPGLECSRQHLDGDDSINPPQSRLLPTRFQKAQLVTWDCIWNHSRINAIDKYSWSLQMFQSPLYLGGGGWLQRISDRLAFLNTHG